jgi:hypothetical protein
MRSCSDELLRGSAEQSTPQAKLRLAATVSGGEMRQGVNKEAVSSFVGRGVPTGVVFRLGALRTSYINAFGQR